LPAAAPSHGPEVALLELLLDGVQRGGRGLQVSTDVVVGEIVLGEGDVGGHHRADPAGHDPVLVEDDAGGHHQARVREEPRVVDVEQFPFIGSLVRHTEVVLERISLRALEAVVRAVRVAAVTGLITIDTSVATLIIDTKFPLGTGLVYDALISVHAAVLRVHDVSLGTHRARLWAASCAVTRTGFVTS